MSTIVGSLAAELGLDTAKFEEGMKRVPGLATPHLNRLSAEMKRTSREGQEAFRVFDEVIGVHLDRPLTRLIVETFPQLANSFKNMLGGLAVTAVGFAVFEAVMSGIERLNRAIDDSRKKAEALVAATHKVETTIYDQTLSAANQLDQIRQRLADLSGDKGGALAAQLRIISRTDAEQAVRSIDAISEAFMAQAKAAAEASSAVTKLENVLAYLFTSKLDAATRKVVETGTELKNTFDNLVLSDPLNGMNKGIAFLNEELAKQKQIQADMHKEELGWLDEHLAKITFLDAYVAKHGSVTKDTVAQQDALVRSLAQQLQLAETLNKVDAGKKKVASAESAAQADVGEKQFDKLRSDTDAQLALAAATGQSVAAQNLQKASGEADALISRILTEAHGRLTAAIKEELAVIHALTAERQVAKDAIQVNAELLKETQTYDQQIASIKRLGEAYKEGGAAIGDALIEEKLEADKQKVAQLTEEYDHLTKAANDYAAGKARLGGAAGPVQGIQGVDPAALAQLKTALDNANASLEQHRRQLEALRSASYTEEINKTSDALRGEQPLLDRLNAAQVRGTEAVRTATVALALYHWEQAHPGATADQIREENSLLEQQSINTQRAADTKAAAQYSIGTLYDDELAKLNRIREIVQQNGESTILIDAKIMDAQDALNKQWDAAIFKVGTFGDKTKAVFNELIVQSHQAGAEIAKAFLSAVDSAEGDLAKLLTGQKVDPAAIAKNLAEQVTKAQIQKGVGALASRVPGLAGFLGTGASKPDGSSETAALWVKIANAPTLSGSSAGSASGTLDVSSLFSNFAGLFAGGGDITPGKSAIVGEKGPEVLSVTNRGVHVMSNRDLKSGAIYQGHRVTQNFNYNGAGDGDLFRRTTKQNSARQARDLRSGLRRY